MREPPEFDRENILEISFVRQIGVEARANAAVAAAIAQIEKFFPGNPRADTKCKARLERFRRAFPDTSIIDLAVGEFLTGAMPRAVDANLREVLDEIATLGRKAANLQRRLAELGSALSLSNPTAAGSEVGERATMAASDVAEAWQHLFLASENLKRAADLAPADGRGRGGSLGKMRVAPEVAFLRKLEAIWMRIGLSPKSGIEGDCLDVFLFHAIKTFDPKLVAGGGWLEKLRAKARKEVST